MTIANIFGGEENLSEARNIFISESKDPYSPYIGKLAEVTVAGMNDPVIGLYRGMTGDGHAYISPVVVREFLGVPGERKEFLRIDEETPSIVDSQKISAFMPICGEYVRTYIDETNKANHPNDSGQMELFS